MKIKKVSFLVVFFMVASTLLASPITSMEKRLYELCRINGAAPPSSFSPWTPSELALSIPEEAGEGNAAHDMAVTAFSPSGKAFAWSIPIKMNLEFYFKSDDLYKWEDRLPVFELPMSFSFADMVSFRSGFMMKLRRGLVPNGMPFATNLSNFSSLDDSDYFWPDRGFVQVNTSWFGLMAGRIPMHMGPGKTGSLLISNNVNYYDAILMKFFNRTFEFSTSVQFFPSEAEMGIGKRTFEILIFHRFEFVVFRKARISVSESIMYSDEHFDLRYINPMLVYHQFFTEKLTNSMIAIDLDWNIIKGLGLYGQLAMDQYQLSAEDHETPDAFGYQIGLEYCTALSKGNLSCWFEFTQTDPWLYHRDGIDYITWFRYREGYEKKYVGYPYGGDSQVWALGIEYDNLEWLVFALSLSYVRKGEVGMNANFATDKNRADRTPTGIPENDLCLSLRFEAGPLYYLKFIGGFGLHYKTNFKHVTGCTDVNIQGNIGLSFQI